MHKKKKKVNKIELKYEKANIEKILGKIMTTWT